MATLKSALRAKFDQRIASSIISRGVYATFEFSHNTLKRPCALIHVNRRLLAEVTAKSSS
jgi:hypothetical protein